MSITSEVDWPTLIAHVLDARSRVFEQDRGRFWPYALPRVGASEEEIVAAETRLGRRLDVQYRDFLHFADGWPYVYQGAQLFGTRELGAGQLWDEAVSYLKEIRDYSPELPTVSSDSDWMPIAIDPSAPALFVQSPEGVIWFSAGGLADSWLDFASFLGGLLELNRRNAYTLTNDPKMVETLAEIPIPDEYRNMRASDIPQ